MGNPWRPRCPLGRTWSGKPGTPRAAGSSSASTRASRTESAFPGRIPRGIRLGILPGPTRPGPGPADSDWADPGRLITRPGSCWQRPPPHTPLRIWLSVDCWHRVSKEWVKVERDNGVLGGSPCTAGTNHRGRARCICVRGGAQLEPQAGGCFPTVRGPVGTGGAPAWMLAAHQVRTGSLASGCCTPPSSTAAVGRLPLVLGAQTRTTVTGSLGPMDRAQPGAGRTGLGRGGSDQWSTVRVTATRDTESKPFGLSRCSPTVPLCCKTDMT